MHGPHWPADSPARYPATRAHSATAHVDCRQCDDRARTEHLRCQLTSRPHRPARPTFRSSRRRGNRTTSRRGLRTARRHPRASRRVGISWTPARANAPPRVTRAVPAPNQVGPKRAISARCASVSTFCTSVGRPSTPRSKGNGGFSVGFALRPSTARTSAVSSPATNRSGTRRNSIRMRSDAAPLPRWPARARGTAATLRRRPPGSDRLRGQRRAVEHEVRRDAQGVTGPSCWPARPPRHSPRRRASPGWLGDRLASARSGSPLRLDLEGLLRRRAESCRCRDRSAEELPMAVEAGGPSARRGAVATPVGPVGRCAQSSVTRPSPPWPATTTPLARPVAASRDSRAVSWSVSPAASFTVAATIEPSSPVTHPVSRRRAWSRARTTRRSPSSRRRCRSRCREDRCGVGRCGDVRQGEPHDHVHEPVGRVVWLIEPVRGDSNVVGGELCVALVRIGRGDGAVRRR